MAQNNGVPPNAGAGQMPQPPNIQDQVMQILTNQQMLMAEMAQQLAATQVAIRNLSPDERVLDSLSSNMAEFVYDKDNGHTFDAWFSRYVDLFDKDAWNLDDAAKVRLLLRKLSPPDHERYNSFILEDSDDYLAYSCKVNKACVDFKLSELTEEQFKCLIYVCGLKGKQDAEIRMRLINKFNEAVDLTLQQVVEQCNSLVNLKQDAVLVENPSSVVNAVAYNKWPKSRHQSAVSNSFHPHQREQPKTPCWSCGGMHYKKDCRFRDRKCNECGKVGHREGYCACFQSRASSNASTHTASKRKRPSTKTVTIHNSSQGRKFVELQVNNVPLRLQLDTGSDIYLISHRSWIKMGQPKTKPTVCTARTASGHPLKLVAEMWCSISLNNVTKEGKWFVAAPNVSAQPNQSLATLQAKFPEVFSSKVGLCTKAPVKLVLKGNPNPVFRPKRPVAYCMEGVVEDDICRLESLGILKKVDFADWAAPIVVVRKSNGTVRICADRICADFSTGLNNVLEPNQYPLPLPEDIFARMSSCRVFSHIDLSDAYLQIEGLFQFTRLSPGIKSAPGTFQQLVDTMLAGLTCTVGYLDDIVVGGRTQEEHQRNLHLTLQRLQEFGFTVRIEKCSFYMRQVKYLGQILDSDGIRPDPDKIAPIVSMPTPNDVTTLRAYLGAVNYYGKYVPEMRTLRHPMDQLLKTGSPLLLTHYNPNLKIVVSADASSIGLGARIAHKFPDGTVKAICHASRSLTAAESNYSQIEKEAFGDADILSRLINRHVRPEEEFIIANVEFESSIRSIMNQSLEALPVSFKIVQAKTRKDKTLQQVAQYVKTMWPENKASITNPHIQEFFHRREALSITAGCLIYIKAIQVSTECVLLRVSTSTGPISDIEHLVQTCNECSSVAKTDRKTCLESWPAPEKPWQRIHLDDAGPMDGWYYFILVDAYTKWPEVVQTKDITSAATLRILRNIFARFGFPETVVSDNGTQFTSEVFEAYCESNAILHLKTAPYHPQSNGLAGSNQLRTRHLSDKQLPAFESPRDQQTPLSILLGSWNLNALTPELDDLPPLPPELNEDLPPQVSHRQQHSSPQQQQQQPTAARTSSRTRRLPARYVPYHLC
ncbi:uncharacterized protein K02A2.6-like [Ochlerotatus camptorhynchus]|uniref:uncharacterized protein K02A2.6-like n=1 Tax=Ochlerotatus camptorhynchus TaxID=644619 RepID=UPI0031D88F6F